MTYKKMKNRAEVEEQLAEYIKERELTYRPILKGRLDGYIEALQWVLKEENAL